MEPLNSQLEFPAAKAGRFTLCFLEVERLSSGEHGRLSDVRYLGSIKIGVARLERHIMESSESCMPRSG